MIALPTDYSGVRFRSRLEARWAVFLDHLKIRWQYEAECYVLADGTCYTPDFWLPRFGGGTHAEVRPEGDPFEVPRLFALETERPIWLCAGEPRCTNWTVLQRAACATAESDALHTDALHTEVVEYEAVPLVCRARGEYRFFWDPGFAFTEEFARTAGATEYLAAVEAARTHRFWTPAQKEAR